MLIISAPSMVTSLGIPFYVRHKRHIQEGWYYPSWFYYILSPCDISIYYAAATFYYARPIPGLKGGWGKLLKYT